jgi:hypothetical protein
MKIGRYLFVWEWPTGKMAWFFWGYGGEGYRIGPLTLWILKPQD